MEILAPGFSADDRLLSAGIKTKTDFLPSATAGAAGGVFIAGSNAATTANITGNLSGSVGSVTGTVGSVTGAVGSVTGSVASVTNPVTVGAFNAAGLADLFDTDSGSTYASAAAGSVVKEIADHATTPSLTAPGIADAVLDELLAGHTTAGSLSKVVSDVYEFLNGAPTFSAAMDGQGYTSPRALKLDNLDDLDMPVSEVRAQMPSLLLSTTINGAPSSQTSFVLVAGPPNDDALNGALIVVTDSVDDTQKAVGLVKDYDQATKTLTLIADPGIFTFAAGDKVDVIASGTPIPLWLSSP